VADINVCELAHSISENNNSRQSALYKLTALQRQSVLTVCAPHIKSRVIKHQGVAIVEFVKETCACMVL